LSKTSLPLWLVWVVFLLEWAHGCIMSHVWALVALDMI
jgi:hypothetical protein